ncbi:MAG: hypothetical protein IJ733_21175, partial [Lachnospiraceae bacterium]|nr:hypothetical protein [Lachnospiraceae bacterium]
MADFEKLYEELSQIVGEEHVKRNELLSKHTTFRIGGPAKLFVTPSDIYELEAVLFCVRGNGDREKAVRYFVMGNGSNLLAGDAGFDGVIISTHRKGQKGRPGGLSGLEDYGVYSEEEIFDLWRRFLGQAELSLPEEVRGKRFVLSGSGILLSALANGIAEAGLAGFEFAS